MRQAMIAILAALTLFGCSSNRNVPLPYSIADALARPEYEDRLQGVAFYFGGQRHPPIKEKLIKITTSQRSSTHPEETSEPKKSE